MAVLTRNTGGVSKDMTSAAPAQLAKFDAKWNAETKPDYWMGRGNELLGCYFIKTFESYPVLILCYEVVLLQFKSFEIDLNLARKNKPYDTRSRLDPII